ncbi:MAG: hypothetical protein PHH14_04300 [Candidatus Margulisbacteria bacterium]|nr:hypothetical protein [Candidatus Margulisiibacteriota bacterium]
MKTKIIASFLLLALTTAVLAESAPLTATDRVKNMANEEAAWRYATGGIKLIAGGLVTAFGYTLFSFRDNVIGAMVLIPVGATFMIPGLVIFGWGAYDLLFGSREYENQYDKLKLASDTNREDQAVTYLKEKSTQDRQSRQPSFWNAFGLFSMFETPAEREYKAYLQEQPAK